MKEKKGMFIMKKEYNSPIADVILFQSADIITVSPLNPYNEEDNVIDDPF